MSAQRSVRFPAEWQLPFLARSRPRPFWAMAMVNRSVPATVTALGILATPAVGIASSALLLGERVDPPLIIATATILAGTVPWGAMPQPSWTGQGHARERTP